MNKKFLIIGGLGLAATTAVTLILRKKKNNGVHVIKDEKEKEEFLKEFYNGEPIDSDICDEDVTVDVENKENK